MPMNKDILAKSRELEKKISQLGGTMTPEQEKQLLKEMLEVRITELVTEGFSRKTAIEKTCEEFEKDFQAEKTEKEQKQFNLLAEAKTELLKIIVNEQAESPEEAARKKKLAAEAVEEKQEEQKGTKNKVSWIDNALDFVPQTSSITQSSLQQALNNAPSDATLFMHVNTHQITFGYHQNPPPGFGKNGNATTLDFNGLRLTGYDMGMHGESRLSLPPNATLEQRAHFIKATMTAEKAIGEQRDSGYSLLNNNCQKARTTLANAVDPTIQQCSMPWNANNEFEKKYDQQKQNRPALADGTITNSIGRTVEPAPRPALVAAQPLN